MDPTTQIEQQLEELSLQVLLSDGAENAVEQWTTSLLNLAQLASEAGRDDLASIAKVAAQSSGQGGFAGDIEKAIGAIRERLQSPGEATVVAAEYSIAQDPELIADFVMESREHLESIEAQLLCIEQDSTDMEAIHSVFRSFHTIKGLAGFLELPRIQEVAHDVETVLDRARQGDFSIDPNAIDVILSSKDYLAKWVKHLESAPTASVPDTLTNNKALLTRVHRLLDDPEPQSEPEAQVETVLVQSVESASVPEPELVQKKAAPKAAAKTAEPAKKAARSVKVDTDKLDYLVDMVGEMVIAQSLVRHDPDVVKAHTPRLTRNLTQLSRITDEVQRTAMSMRMVPIGPLFQKMARLVRDLTRNLGKQANYRTEGDDVQLDRNIVEELADPLMHMVRNAVDHGIERPDQRVAAGKDPSATIELKAFHRSGHIVIQIKDNGRGINREKVLAKARSKGLIGPNANLTDAECFGLIFHPGFSTADQLSDVSGRGVGMDVVKKQIQKLRGSIEIVSVAGEGTTFSLKLPLTLAIIDGLVVGVGTERYIIPLGSVREMLRPSEGMVSSVENRAEVVAVRDQLLPVLRLHERFGIEPNSKNPTETVFVIAECDGASFALMVDNLIGKQEVVIKSLGRTFQHVVGVAGGAILGDGHVGLILDMQGIFGAKKDA